MSYYKRKQKMYTHKVGDYVRVRNRDQSGKHLVYGNIVGRIVSIGRVNGETGTVYTFPRAKLKTVNTSRTIYESLTHLVPDDLK